MERETTSIPYQGNTGHHLTLRHAVAQDAEAIAILHADSWRRHYRGAYRDEFLDGDVLTNRRAVWNTRLATPDADQVTIVADHNGVLAGFAHVILDADPKWGALLDNLHVLHQLKRRGIGSQLLRATARELVRQRPADRRLYLWVLDQNTAAQAFYAARGGTDVETTLTGPVADGGNVLAHRIAWSDATVLIVACEPDVS